MSVIGETWIDDDGNGVCNPGEGIEYVMLVRNAGTVTLSDLWLSDDLLGDQANCGEAPEGGLLAPNASMTCEGTYQVWPLNCSMIRCKEYVCCTYVRVGKVPMSLRGHAALTVQCIQASGGRFSRTIRSRAASFEQMREGNPTKRYAWQVLTYCTPADLIRCLHVSAIKKSRSPNKTSTEETSPIQP